ncbi:MAG: hypothetical protein O9284_01465 [Steroidobacteraceae bacterium]|jgi:hypothetical protein|nr:hypothetical protein [Steroidobacteraceae bacterium]
MSRAGTYVGGRGTRRREREFSVFSMSFLDAICCAFGALILLTVLAQTGVPDVIEAVDTDLKGLIAQREQEIVRLRGETETLNRDLLSRQEQVSDLRARLARLQGELSKLQGQFQASTKDAAVATELEGRLSVAQQSLSAEMQRLLGAQFQRAKDAPVGGIPVDSEYVIFLVDTSGSMQSYSWQFAKQKLREVLEIYPRLKGIQVMSDQGFYMFSEYRGKWIPDTPARRQAILRAFDNWNAFSASSPAEGIVQAIRTFWTPEHKISIYVFGDEFTGQSIQQVVDTVDRVNRVQADGTRAVRIHAIGFPLDPNVPQFTNIRFAQLMRIVTQRNGGSFVGLVR